MKSPFSFFNSSTDEQRLQDLKGLTLFKGLTTRELRELDELLHERSYHKDEVIFDEGDAGLGLFIVVSGRVKILSSHAGLKHLSPEFGRGDFFGELALFDEAPRTARAAAIEPTSVVALFRTEFFSLLERDRGIASKILYELSRTVCRRSRNLVMDEHHSPMI
jgi:CRP/FNR family transcriptional regulator, cyclic AMP receptor protein